MIPELTIRSFSTDQYLLDKMVYANFYGLKKFAPEGQNIVVDIGAHCGYFTFAALAMGAKKVYSFEPFLENYKTLLKNINPSLGQVFPYQLGVYTTSCGLTVKCPQLTKEGVFDFGSIAPSTNQEGVDYVFPCVILDDILKLYTGGYPIDVLKFSIGYADVEIFDKSKMLVGVKNVCGETEMTQQTCDIFKAVMKQHGFIDSSFKPVDGENGKVLYHFSKTKVTDNFIIK